MEGSGEEAQAVRAPASWLFQAVSSPPRHQAYLKDQGHRKGVDLFLSSFCFFVNPCFGMPHSPTEEESKAGLVGVDDGFGESNRGDEGGFWNCFVV